MEVPMLSTFIRRAFMVVVLPFVLFGTVRTFAQTGTTSLRGEITDNSGAAIVGASITVKNIELGIERHTVGGATGQYEFLALPPGTYALTVEKDGFDQYIQTKIALLVNLPTTLNVTLKVGSPTITIEVSTETTGLNTTDASLGSAFSTFQVKELPLEAGNVPDLLSLQAGVVYTGNNPNVDADYDTRSGSVNGAHSDQSNITLDGVDVNTDTKGYAFTSVLPITQDSVQEFRVTTSNYNADEGRSGGAQVSLVTKSGTNAFHGAVFETNRNTATSANDYFLKLAQLQSGDPNKAPPLVRNNFGSAVGGPIVKDRFFFFVDYQGLRQRQSQSAVEPVPSAAQQDGVVQYVCANPSQCPGGTVQGLTSSHTVAPGTFALGPAQIQTMDPQGVGENSVVLNYLKTFAAYPANDSSVGDGLNVQGYRFAAPVATDDNWYIARADYKITRDGNQTLFWRGALRNDFIDGAPYLPNLPPLTKTVDYSKGLAVGYSAVLTPTVVNNFRYGYTRQSYGVLGNQSEDVIYLESFNGGAYSSTNSYQVPVNNFVDDISWNKGKHTLQFGSNISILRNPQSNNINSFDSANVLSVLFDTSKLAGSGVAGHFDPGCSITAGPCGGTAYPVVASTDGEYYDQTVSDLAGMITSVTANYNYTRNGTILPGAAPVTRRFAEDGWEMYAQDQWKVSPTLTVTAGLRYSLFSPPWETNGNQVAPNPSLSTYFNDRASGMLNGVPASAACCISFDLAGPANHAPGFYNWNTKDFGPRVGFAWSPAKHSGLLGSVFGDAGQSVIRGGFSMVYDRMGPELLATFDASGSYGMSTSLGSALGVESPACAPRITGLTGYANIPQEDNCGRVMLQPAPPAVFPQTFPSALDGNPAGYATYWGMDNHLKTPYAYTADLSYGRQLGHGFQFQASYVGRIGHHILAQEDVATPLDLYDPKTKIDYFTAVDALARLYRQGVPISSITAQRVGPTAQYWTDMLQSAPAYESACGTVGMNALQGAYALFSCNENSEVVGLQSLDQGWGLINPVNNQSIYAVTGPYSFVDPQFASLYAWRSIGNSVYNALQINVRKNLTHGVQFEINYTYSHSIDLSSSANRIGVQGGLSGLVINPYDPNLGRADSDYDLRHQVNANWIAQLPFGKGQWIGGDSSGFVNALIGGWQFAGLARWTSGFPISANNGYNWPTNWNDNGDATVIGPVTTRGAVKNPNGTVNLFGSASEQAAAFAAFEPAFPGQIGNRNILRGDGFAGLDLGLSKRWKMPYGESHTLQFRWDVFNALNLTRFDVQSLSLGLSSANTFGNYTGELTNPRVMQFTLRYEF
jgi:Carboxypeptidase regulatory-like domain